MLNPFPLFFLTNLTSFMNEPNMGTLLMQRFPYFALQISLLLYGVNLY
jgi:hypothetical protein